MYNPEAWTPIGTIVGSASTSEFTFILRRFGARVGDIVVVEMDIPRADRRGTQKIYAWGRITGIDRFNPFLPYEAAQELANEDQSLIDTVLSSSRDQLEAKVLILGCTNADNKKFDRLYPLTYPIPPAVQVLYPPANAVRLLLAGHLENQTPIKIGSLIARSDVEVSISAERIVSRHLAILAMTGGGKTVAARRILRELIDIGYPVVIIDPHGDYLGLFEQSSLFKGTDVRLFYPHVHMTGENKQIVDLLVAKMTLGPTEAQRQYMDLLLNSVDARAGESVLDYIKDLIDRGRKDLTSKRATKGGGSKIGRNNPQGKPQANSQTSIGGSTINAVVRSLEMVAKRLQSMELSNERLRGRLKDFDFESMPDPYGSPERIVRPKQVSILYLGGYDDLTQSTIVSILLEALFGHRAALTEKIAPFCTVVEEAHNFVPSLREGTEDKPSLLTLRRIITEGRKFGVGLVLISQRPSRLDETVISQCNSFLVLRLVNPRDQRYVRDIMENLPESDARMLPGFGPGQGIVSGQAVRFPLIVQIKYDEELVSRISGADEDFVKKAKEWKPDPKAGIRAQVSQRAKKIAKFPSRRPKRGS